LTDEKRMSYCGSLMHMMRQTGSALVARACSRYARGLLSTDVHWMILRLFETNIAISRYLII